MYSNVVCDFGGSCHLLPSVWVSGCVSSRPFSEHLILVLANSLVLASFFVLFIYVFLIVGVSVVLLWMAGEWRGSVGGSFWWGTVERGPTFGVRCGSSGRGVVGGAGVLCRSWLG